MAYVSDGSRVCDSARGALAAINAVYTLTAKSQLIIFCGGIVGTTGDRMSQGTGGCALHWRRAGGTFAAMTNATEVKIAASGTVLANGTGVDATDARTTKTPTFTAGAGVEVQGAASSSALALLQIRDIASGEWQYAVDFSDAPDGQAYQFRFVVTHDAGTTNIDYASTITVPIPWTTRVWIPSTGTPPLPTLAIDAGWNKSTALVRVPGGKTRANTAQVNKNSLSTATSPEFHLCCQCQIPGLMAQTLSGFVKGQIGCSVNNATMVATVVIGMRVFSSDGATLRGTLLPLTFSDATTVPPAFPVTTQPDAINRKFMDLAESPNIALTSVVCSLNDVLVIEIGFRDTDVGTSRSGNIIIGDPAALPDLPEDETSNSNGNFNPWLEFSADIALTTDLVQLRPDGDVAAGTWTATGAATLAGAIDEATTDDADFIQSAVTPVNDVAEVTVQDPATVATGTFSIFIRARK